MRSSSQLRKQLQQRRQLQPRLLAKQPQLRQLKNQQLRPKKRQQLDQCLLLLKNRFQQRVSYPSLRNWLRLRNLQRQPKKSSSQK